MPLAPLPPQIDFRLNHRLRRVAGYLRAIEFHRRSAIIWAAVALTAALLLLAQEHSAFGRAYAAHSLVPVFIVAAGVSAWLIWRDRTGVRDAADYVGAQYPDANSALQAAVEQLPGTGGDLHFLQRRVIDEALRHSETADWNRRPRRQAWALLAVNVVAMAVALGISLLVLRAHRPPTARTPLLPPTAVEISPGSVEVERGSTVLVAARFGEAVLPGESALVWQATGNPAQRAAMSRSLSDPVFALTLPAISADTVYHVEYGGQRSAEFSVRVFDRPALVKADATLHYPEYTGLAERQLPDTRRISAVVGTVLDYEFAMNKPLARAVLRETTSGEELALVPTGDRTRFRLNTVLEKSARYSLQLADAEGRTNAALVDIRIEVVENRRPELKLKFPRGDQRVSPLEELQLEAETRDDFGLRDYGLGYSVAEAPPSYLSLAPVPLPARSVEARLDHLLRLEEHGVKADQLVTWFAWADDVGPDGQIRRTTTDVFFAEVRRLDEIFRENANGSGRNQPGSGGGVPGQELVELQRQISIGIWKLRQQDRQATTFATDATTLLDSQTQAQQQLATLRERLEEPSARAAAEAAAPFMQQAADALSRVAKDKSAADLDAAWSAARSAYQALLRTQPRDTDVSQSRSGSQSGRSRSREQLNELEFRNEQDRYETETQAQPPPTPEEREQLQVLAKLRELARRQQDLNARLQELQTALAAAADDAQREAIRRELKRLEDEQRQMMSNLDETRQRVDRLQPGQQTQQAREQLDRTRQEMQRASEQLEQGQVTQALAAGTRAQENLKQTSEDLRREAAGRFSDQMRQARQQARDLAADQQKARRDLEALSRGQQSLDDSAPREELANRLQQQAQRRDQLLEQLRQVTEESEGTEPRLHRQLYDLLREQGQSGVSQQLANSAEMLRRGFVDPARETQAGIASEFEKLQRSVERAANAVLGDETSELRFAQRELEALTRELKRENGSANAANDEPANDGAPKQSPADQQPGDASDQSGALARNESKSDTTESQQREPASAASNAETGAGPGGAADPTNQQSGAQPQEFQELARNFGGAGAAPDAPRGPLTGNGFADWAERLRTVEDLMESPEQRQRLAGARAQAEQLRRDNQRKGQAPKWSLVEMGIVAPLEQTRAWLRQELNRREQPDALQPVDRDPVPERYTESVRKYYEALGEK